MKTSPRLWLLLASLALSGVLLFQLLSPGARKAAPVVSSIPSAPSPENPALQAGTGRGENLPPNPEPDPALSPTNELARSLLANLERLLQRNDARPQEALLTFQDDDAYRRFLQRAGEAGLAVLDHIDGFRSARVKYDSLDSLQRDLLANAADYGDVGANFLVNIPQVPAKEDRAAIQQIPFGNRTLEFLGASGDRSQWGRGSTIAILDSGVSGDATFGTGRLRAIDIGLGTAAGNEESAGHGTAVAALAAGLSADAPGISPAANLLSVRVTDSSGTSDIFTLARAILTATDAGAKIINVSLGGYGTNAALSNAITYASERGALVVAAAGNDQAAQLTWPAADPRVVSVGAVDAAGQQVTFSNSGSQLQVVAPGYGVQTALLNGQRVSFSGTSASAPIVSGAIAAVMSENPGVTAQQAWEILQRTTSDSGAPGADANYGNGILNLGWAMNRNNPAYLDTAIASHYYDAANKEMDFVVQNRSGQAVNGLQLNVTASGSASSYPLPPLAAGASTIVRLPVDAAAIRASGGISFSTQLLNPAGVTDRVPANNRRSSTLSPAAK